MLKRVVFKAEREGRLDLLIKEKIDLTRSEIIKLIKTGSVKIENKTILKAGEFLKQGQEIEVKLELGLREGDKLIAEAGEVEIVYEDDNLIVINKDSGLVVHPGSGRKDKTLVNRLVYHFESLSDQGGQLRPGLVHRLDKDTSGLILVAKNNRAHNYLANQLKQREIKREYLAIVIGSLKAGRAIVDLPIGRHPRDRRRFIVGGLRKKESKTMVYPLKEFNYQGMLLSLVRCELLSGRTHQIRVHLAAINLPIYGDPLYSKAIDSYGQRLHAFKISFKDLDGGIRTFEVGVPREKFLPFLDVIKEELVKV